MKRRSTSSTRKEVLKNLKEILKNYMRDSDISTKTGMVKMDPFRGTRWIAYKKEVFIVSYGRNPQIY